MTKISSNAKFTSHSLTESIAVNISFGSFRNVVLFNFIYFRISPSELTLGWTIENDRVKQSLLVFFLFYCFLQPIVVVAVAVVLISMTIL